MQNLTVGDLRGYAEKVHKVLRHGSVYKNIEES